MNREALAQDRRARRGGLLEPLARAPVEEGRGERQRPEGEGASPRLRQRRRPAQGRADRRRRRRADDRLPHRPPLVLLPALRGRRLARGRAGLERSRNASTDSGAMNERTAKGNDTLARLAGVIAARRGADPATSYVARLVAKGDDAVLKKIGEEATEVVMACKDGDPAADRRRGRRPLVPHHDRARRPRPDARRRARRARAARGPVGARGIRRAQDDIAERQTEHERHRRSAGSSSS